MAQIIEQGNPITLDLLTLDDQGDAIDGTGVTATIIDAAGATVVNAAVPVHVGLGHYQYVYAVAAAAQTGAWAVRWFGTIDGDLLQIDEGFTVVRAGALAAPASGSSVCQAWATHEDAIGPCATYGVDPDQLDEAMLIASDVLWNLTGRKWAGVCSDSIRPQAQWRAREGLPRWWPAVQGGMAAPWGFCSCHRGRETGCSAIPEIALPRGPVVADSIVVKIDGELFEDFRLDDHKFLVRTDGQGWPCFPAGTLVLTDTGLKPIETIQAGERVLTHRNRWRTVTRSGKTGDSETMTIVGKGGSIQCTPDHRFLSAPVLAGERRDQWVPRKLGASEWTTADQLTGRAWATPREVEALPVPMPDGWLFVPARFWWFLGRWVGDGWTDVRSSRVAVCAGHHEADELADVLSEMGWIWKRDDNRTTVKFRFSDRVLHAWLREQFGTRAHNKRLPAWLLGASETIRSEFLAGYVSADGWRAIPVRGRPFTSLRTVSRALAFGTRLLVASLGYAPSLYEREQTTTHIEGRAISGRRTYRIDWSDTKPGEPYTQGWIDDEHLWGRVRSVDLDETIVAVYDLEVEEDHSFVADGFVVHNCCQDLLLDDTNEQTWSVAYDFGRQPPIGGRKAAAVLGCELHMLYNPDLTDRCRIPKRVTTVQRQGVTLQLKDVDALFTDGKIGIPEVDLWVASELLGVKRRRMTVMIPGRWRSARRVGR